MAKATNNAEFNTFALGLITEGNEVNYPQGAIRDMLNFEIQRTGAAEIRPPMANEAGTSAWFTVSASPSLPVTGWYWGSPDGDASTEIILTQIGSQFKVLKRSASIGAAVTDITPATASHMKSGWLPDSAISCTVVNGVASKLKYATNGKWCVITGLEVQINGLYWNEVVVVLEYNRADGTLTAVYDFLYTRDFWGVADARRDGERVPAELFTSEVAYNLFNQGWGNEVNGSAPNKYVIRDFYNNGGTAVENSIAVYQAVSGAGDLTLNGEYVSGGVAYMSDIPNVVTVDSDSGADNGLVFTITGTYKGESVTDTITLNTDNITAGVQVFDTVTQVTAGGAAVGSIRVGTDRLYPGDKDNWTLGVYDSSVTERGFAPNFVTKSPDSAGTTPRGTYIIPVNCRKTSLDSAFAYGRGKFLSQYRRVFNTEPWPLSDDRSGRPYSVCSAFGRFWYSMTTDLCRGQTTNRRSPNIGSYVFFSNTVTTRGDIVRCHQKQDPTSPDFNEILDDDGGFVYIPEADGIHTLISVGNGLVCIAKNGTWMVSGPLDSGFKATDYQTIRLSKSGCLSEDSVVLAAGSALFFSSTGIEIIGYQQGQGLQQVNISDDKVKSFLLDNVTDWTNVRGTYDSVRNKVRWLIDYTSGEYTKELALDTVQNCFEVHQYQTGSVQILGYISLGQEYNRKFSGTDILASTVLYITKQGTDVYPAQLRYDDQDGSALSWEDFGTPYGDDSYIELAYLTGGDTQRKKQVSYLTTHFRRTEDGFADIGGVLTPTHPSGCYVRVKWDYDTTGSYNAWTPEYLAYKYRRPYLSSGTSDPYDYGQSVITSKDKIRGYGKSLSIRFRGVDNKDCKILGWGTVLGSNPQV